jgi:accessory gene regulator protein AgrB
MQHLLNKLNKDGYFTEIQMEQIKYSALVILGDASKFLILFVAFSLLGYWQEYVYAFVTTTFLRIHIGGKHYNTYLGCLLFSTGYFSLLVFLTVLLPRHYYIYLLIVTIPIALVLILTSPRVSIKSGRNVKKNLSEIKRNILVLIVVYLLLFIIIREPIFLIGPFTIILQTIQLLTMKGGSYYEIRKETRLRT